MQNNFDEGFGIFWIKNLSEKQLINKITFEKMEGLKFRKPFCYSKLQLLRIYT